LAALGVDDPENYVDPNSEAVAGVLRGNSELEEEEASTTTYGFVFQPEFAPGLTLSLDWYDIKIDNAVNTAVPQEAAEICVDSPSINNNTFCNLFTREQGTGAIIDFVQQPVNVANFVTKGYDLNLRYVFDGAALGMAKDIGKFTLVVVGNKLQDLTFVNLPGAPADPDAGEADAPEWQTNFDLTWEIKSLTLNYGLSWFDETQRYTLQERNSNPDIVDSRYFDYDAKLTQDFYARYELLDGLAVFGGVNNFTNEKPDIGEYDYPVSPIGRAFFAGVKMSVL
ncbi:MAG: TonB-dependent receptor, partial [Rhodoglobus sp.]|nr:TonB-dependent receptor [Rhodoglobus sp.]